MLFAATHNIMHAMETTLTNPTNEELFQAHTNMAHGLSEYNFERFKRGYEIHKRASSFYIENDMITDPKFRILSQVEENFAYRIQSIKNKTEQPDFNAQSYRKILQGQKNISYILLTIGSMYMAQGAYQCIIHKDDSWYNYLQILVGIIPSYCGYTLLCDCNKKSTQAETIVANRKRAAQKIFDYLNSPKQSE